MDVKTLVPMSALYRVDIIKRILPPPAHSAQEVPPNLAVPLETVGRWYRHSLTSGPALCRTQIQVDIKGSTPISPIPLFSDCFYCLAHIKAAVCHRICVNACFQAALCAYNRKFCHCNHSVQFAEHYFSAAMRAIL